MYNLSVDTCLMLKCTNTQIKESQKSCTINLQVLKLAVQKQLDLPLLNFAYFP